SDARARARDAVEPVALGADELAEIVQRPHLDKGDDVVRPGHSLRGDDPLDPPDLAGDLRTHPHLGLHEDVAAKHRPSGAHHTRRRGDQGRAWGTPASRTSVDPFRYSALVPSISAIVARTSDGMPRSPAQRLSSVP